MNDMGFNVAGHMRHEGATPSPPDGIVVKHTKTAWQPSGHCPRHVLFKAQTHPIISICCIKESFIGDLLI